MIETAARTGASFARGSSKQDYSTPKDFLEAVRLRYGNLDLDLAAHRDNAVTGKWLGPGGLVEDTLVLDPSGCWSIGLLGNLNHSNHWLNPPYDDIGAWAEWCCRSSFFLREHQRILLLVPASVGSEWFANYVWPRAHVNLLRPRLSFDGKNPYPKDCMLSVYGKDTGKTFECWKWSNGKR